MDGSTVVEEFLAHHGVKGMKWGVRRAASKSGRKSGSGKYVPKRTEQSSDSQKARGLARNNRKTLTNQELQTVITRLNLEQQFSRLNPTPVQRGQNVIKQLTGMGNDINNAFETIGRLETSTKKLKR